jgi:hypothetical protein
VNGAKIKGKLRNPNILNDLAHYAPAWPNGCSRDGQLLGVAATPHDRKEPKLTENSL